MLNQHVRYRLWGFRQTAWTNWVLAPSKEEREFWAYLYNLFAEEVEAN